MKLEGNKRKFIISGITAIVMILFAGIVFATTHFSSGKNYAIDVIDDGSTTVTSDDNIEFQTKVVDSSENSEITLETSIKNKIENKNKEIALVIDTSYSMQTNGYGYDVTDLAKSIVNQLCNESSNVSISVTDSNNVKLSKIALNSSNVSTVNNAIDNVTTGTNDISTVLDNAYGTLTASPTDIEQYVIILSDATDDARDKLQELSSKGVKVTSILAGITSTSFGTPASPIPADGKVFMMDDFDVVSFVDSINKIVKNVDSTITFCDKILQERHFFLVDIEKDTDGNDLLVPADTTGNTWKWNVNKIKAGDTAKVTYKLRLNTAQTIGNNDLYKNLNVIKHMKVNYSLHNGTETLSKETTSETAPVIQICDAYRVVLHAVGNGTTMPAPGIKFNVRGVNRLTGEVVIDKTGLESDESGDVDVGLVSELGDVIFTITPTEYSQGFKATDPTTIIVTNEYSSTSGGTLHTSKEDITTVDDTTAKREVEITVAINIQEFTIRLDVSELNNPSARLNGIDFKLIQPRLNNKYEMDALYGTTGADGDGLIDFKGSVMFKDDTYDYIISQTNEKFGYENIGNITLRLKINDDGKVKVNGAETLHNSYATAIRESEDLVVVKITPKSNTSQKFNLQLNLKDKNDGTPIDGTTFKIIAYSATGTVGDKTPYYVTTTDGGKVNIDVTGKDDSLIILEIYDEGTNSKYKNINGDPRTPTTIRIYRKNGIIGGPGATDSGIVPGPNSVRKNPDNNNGIIVDLEAEKKAESNEIQIHLTEKDYTDTNLTGYRITLTDDTPAGEANAVHRGTTDTATTQADGIARFTLDDPTTMVDGEYIYKVSIDNNDLNRGGYRAPDVVAKIKVSVLNGRIVTSSVGITDVTDVHVGSFSPINGATSFIKNEKAEIYNVGYMDYILEPTADAASFSVHLVDEESNVDVAGGKYVIEMERGGEVLCNSDGKITKASGYTDRMIIPGLDATPVTITITQVYDDINRNGYIPDTKHTYKITVYKDISGIHISDYRVQDGSSWTMPVPTIEGTKVVFNHKNRIQHPEDVIINFNVMVYDWASDPSGKMLVPVQGLNLKIWSDDFDIYNNATGAFDTFDESNPYNPFTTGVSADSTVEGQVSLRLKPNNLPTVEIDTDGSVSKRCYYHIAQYDVVTNSIIPGTRIDGYIDLTYLKSLGTYQYSGHYAERGSELVKEIETGTPEFTEYGYEEVVKLGIWTNYGRAANIGFDFSKEDLLGNEINDVDTRYLVKVSKSSGQIIPYDVHISNGTDTVELSGTFVNEGDIISFEELVPPNGYSKPEIVDAEGNTVTVNFSYEVTNIDPDLGVINLQPVGEESALIQMTGVTTTIDESGNTKIIQKVTFKDAMENSMPFGITSVEKDVATGTEIPLEGNSFRFVTDTQNIATTQLTDSNGYVSTQIGNEIPGGYMEYTISQNIIDGTKVTQYYKRINDIHVKLYFDLNGNIVTDSADPNYYGNIQTDPNYGITWYIKGVNGENKIDIVIIHEREDALKVKLVTKDEFTNAILPNNSSQIATYAVRPSVVLQGIGATNLDVGFVDPGRIATYTLTSAHDVGGSFVVDTGIDVVNNYISIAAQQFIVTYDSDGNVATAQPTPASADYIDVVPSTTDPQEIEITVKLEPAVPFVIHNTDAFTGANLQNGEFTIERVVGESTISVTGTTDADGQIKKMYVGEFGTGNDTENTTYTYLVRQTRARSDTTNTYATAEEFKIEVDYNANREIVDARLAHNTKSTDNLVTVSKIQPSSSTDVGYNGNDKGIVCIEVKNNPAFNIQFNNVDYSTLTTPQTPLQGAKFDVKADLYKYPITSTNSITATSISTTAETPDSDLITGASAIGTGSDGIELVCVDRTPIETGGTTRKYTIKNTVASPNYQLVLQNIEVEVDFDENGQVNISNENPVRVVSGGEYAEAGWYRTPSTNAEKFGIKLKVNSKPAFRINIDNIDRAEYENGNIVNLAGAKYSITSDYSTSADVEKATTGAVTAYLGETPINDDVTYTIHETKAAVGYQTIEKDIILKVHFAPNGEIDRADGAVQITQGDKYSEYTLVNPIVVSADNFTVNLTIRNNPLIALDMYKRNPDGTGLENVKFHISAKIKDTNEEIYNPADDFQTLASGMVGLGVDRALDNQTIIYTIRETKNIPGYEYIPEELKIEVTYDNIGRIAKDADGNYIAKLTPVVDWATLTCTNDYRIGHLTITDDFIKEVGININTLDKYDPTEKKAEQAKINAYFVKDMVTYNKDDAHAAEFITGRDDDGDGNPDTAHGNDFQTFGKADTITKSGNTGVLVLEQDEADTPNTYYNVSENKSYDNIYMPWIYYGIRRARIDVTFTDEGKVASANLGTDAKGTTPLGKLLDGQYINITTDSTNPYLINIDLYYYPMLELKINAKSDNNYDRAPDPMDNDLLATYQVRTSKIYNADINTSRTEEDNRNRGLIYAGYVGESKLHGQIGKIYKGNGERASKIQSMQLDNTTNTWEPVTRGYWPGEQGYTRKFYIYEPNNVTAQRKGTEKSEPQNAYQYYTELQYQQHGMRDGEENYLSYNNHLIGTITVNYDEHGNIIDDIISTSCRKDVNGWNSYISADRTENKHGLEINIEYKRTTVITARVVDSITDAEMQNVTLMPGKNNLYTYKQDDPYHTYDYFRLANGANTWKYWKGNEKNGSRQVNIGTHYGTWSYSNGWDSAKAYNGYDAIGNVKLDIHYDQYGFVDMDNTKVTSTDASGNPNAVIERVDKTRIYLKILANRKFAIQIDKKDSMNNTKTIETVKFGVKSTKTDIKSGTNLVNTKTGIEQGTRTGVGLIHANKVVTYTIQETKTPSGYIPLDTFDMDVAYGSDGLIKQVKLEDGTSIYDAFGIHDSPTIPIKLVNVNTSTAGVKEKDKVDLRFELTNTPRFDVDITVSDQFYQEEKLPGVTYSIEDITHHVPADGALITQDNGKLSTYVGSPYKNETVRYKISQTNTATTPYQYYPKATRDIVVDVDFDSNGYIDGTPRVVSGDDVQLKALTVKKGNRGIELQILNKPKEVRFGIEKYDELNKNKLNGVEFQITSEEISPSTTSTTFDKHYTDSNGNYTQTVNDFTTQREMLYTISETKQLPEYRAMEDIVFKVKYNEQGEIIGQPTFVNPLGDGIKITKAEGSLETLANGEKVHFKIEIANDDAYDLVVKDEDKNVSRLGIAESKYQVYINGNPTSTSLKETNSKGIFRIKNRRESGNIAIKVAEKSVGKGYKSNALNVADIDFIKGTYDPVADVTTYSLELDTTTLSAKGYSLVSGPTAVYDTDYHDGKEYIIELDSASGTQVIVDVYEDTGKIVYTFKNESKSALNITKLDTEHGRVDGAEFKVSRVELDQYGNEIGTPVELDNHLTTLADGKTEDYDLGSRPISKTIRYYFEEVTPPEGSLSIGTVYIDYKYNEKGLITKRTPDRSKRIADNGTKPYDVNVRIKNGNLNTYSVKVISVDSRNGSTSSTTNRINGSKMDIKVKDSSGNVIKQVNNSTTGTVDTSYGYQEEGAILLDGLRKDGHIFVEVNQPISGIAEGFVQGSNQLTGTVEFDAEFDNTTTVPTVNLQNLNNGGFIDSYINTVEDQIVIVVKSDPQMKIHLHKEDSKTGKPIEGAKFTITSVIDGLDRAASIPTDLNVHTAGTDANGDEIVTIGEPEYGKSIIYTITEDPLDGYEASKPSIIRVTYDTYGKIAYWEVQSDESYTQVKDKILKIGDETYNWDNAESEERQRLQATLDRQGIPYNDVYTEGSRTLNTVIKNKKGITTIPYTIIVQTVDPLGQPIKDIELGLTLTQTIGENTIFEPQTTDVNGETTYYANGSGILDMKVDIFDAKTYTIVGSPHAIVLKNSETGELFVNEADALEIKTNEVDGIGNPIIRLILRCSLPANKYNMHLLKVDKSGDNIKENPATFTITRVESIEDFEDSESEASESTDGDLDGTDGSSTDGSLTDEESADEESVDESSTGDSTTEPIEPSEYGDGEDSDDLEDPEEGEEHLTTYEAVVASSVETNENGLLQLEKLTMPTKAGTYTYRIYENESPEGYKKVTEPFEIDVTFEKDEFGNMTITNVVPHEGTKDASILKFAESGFVVRIENSEDVPADAIMFNIYKVDGETNEKLDGAWIRVTLPDEENTKVVTQSGENAENVGQFDYVHVEQGKDYLARLKYIPRPDVETVKAAPDGILTHVYQFEEIAAPEGYVMDGTLFEMTIEYEVVTEDDGTEAVKIKSATSSNTDLLDIYDVQEDQLNANILNTKENVVTAHEIRYHALDEDGLDDTTVTNMPTSPQLKGIEIPLSLASEIPEKAGKVFVEWNTAPDGTGTSFAPGSTYTVDADLDLYAIWEDAKYKITYVENAPIGPTGVAVGLVENMPYDPTHTQTKTHDVDITLDDDDVNPTILGLEEDYIFKGWNTDPNGISGIHYEPGDIYSGNEDLTLYAEWNYIIKYDANVPVDVDGFPISSTPATDIPENQQANVKDETDLIIDDLSVYPNAPTLEGYVFKEWNTKADGTGDTYNPNDAYSQRKSVTLYAIWQYEITYDENKPVNEDGFPIDCTISNMPVTNPEKAQVGTPIIVDNTTDNPNVPTMDPDDYEFKEWNTKADGTGDSYKPDDSYADSRSVTLYAIWEETNIYLKSDTYKITDVEFSGNKIHPYRKYELKTEDENEYNVGDKYILGIRPEINTIKSRRSEHTVGTTWAEFKGNIETNAKIVKCIDHAGKEIEDTDLVSTGYTLRLERGSKVIELKLVVRADVWGKSSNIKNAKTDGKISNADGDKINNFLTTYTLFSDNIALMLACDVDLNGKINAKDPGKAVTIMTSLDYGSLD